MDPTIVNGMAIRNRILQLMAREDKSFDDKSQQTEQAWASTGASAPTAAATTTTPAASRRNRFLTP
jgi:flagellar motor component MotA